MHGHSFCMYEIVCMDMAYSLLLKRNIDIGMGNISDGRLQTNKSF